MKHSVALIPARGGSKSIPHKNLTDLAGKPLIHWTIKAALESNVEHIVVSSDYPPILDYASSMGIDTITRPPQHSHDDAKAIDVVKHALIYLSERDIACDALMYLQPTSPLRTQTHINKALELYEAKNCSSVISVTPVPHNCIPESIMRINDGVLTPYLKTEETYQRQNKPTYVARNGPAIVISKPADILKQNTLYTKPMFGFHMSHLESIDIDTPEDLELIKKLIDGSCYFDQHYNTEKF